MFVRYRLYYRDVLYIHACNNNYIYFAYIKHNLLSLYNTIYLYVFQGCPFYVGKLICSSSVGKTISPTLNIPWLLLALCAEWKPHGPFFFYCCMSIGVIIV